MNEHSVIQALVGRVADEAKARRATAVHRIRVSLGELSGVDPVRLARAYEMFRAATVCSGAALEVAVVPARWVCRACGRPIGDGAPLQCGACGASARMVSDDEILLEQIDLEVP